MGVSQLRIRSTPARRPIISEPLPPVQDFPDTDLPLNYSRLLVIVGGGSVEPAVLQALSATGAALVAADGGAIAIAAAGLVPEAIVGDLDSLGDAAAFPHSRIVQIAEQDTTDFEKALYSTVAPVTVALGMTGKRFDHTLAALDVVARYGAERRIVLVDETDIAVSLSGPFSFTVAAGERVSIHPLQPVHFASSTGLTYALDGLLLAPGIRTGTSNSATAGPFSITPRIGESGCWLLILGEASLFPLLAALLPPG